MFKRSPESIGTLTAKVNREQVDYELDDLHRCKILLPLWPPISPGIENQWQQSHWPRSLHHQPLQSSSNLISDVNEDRQTSIKLEVHTHDDVHSKVKWDNDPRLNVRSAWHLDDDLSQRTMLVLPLSWVKQSRAVAEWWKTWRNAAKNR